MPVKIRADFAQKTCTNLKNPNTRMRVKRAVYLAHLFIYFLRKESAYEIMFHNIFLVSALWTESLYIAYDKWSWLSDIPSTYLHRPIRHYLFYVVIERNDEPIRTMNLMSMVSSSPINFQFLPGTQLFWTLENR